MFKYIKYKYLERKWDRILEKSKFRSWDMYWYWNDPDLNYEGKTPEETLVGFPYLLEVGYEKLHTDIDPMFGPIHSCSNIEQWCRENCRDKVRWAWSTRFRDHMDQYLPYPNNEVEFLILGFKNERDYLWFTLKWM